MTYNSLIPARHHLDKRADRIAADPLSQGKPDDLLRPKVVAAWLGLSTSWLAQARSKGYGPKFTRLTPRMTVYRRADVLAWLEARTHQCTAEYQS